jgi:YD repeat-containing protein
VQNDIVLTQTEYTRDGDGNIIQSVQRDRAHDASGTGDLRGGAASIPGRAQVVGRDLFYNNSSFDGNDAAINSADDGAIDTSKSALLPGQAAGTSNVTGTSLGINGIMIDVAGLSGTPTTADFIFRVGSTGDPSTWAAAPAPTGISVRTGAGTGGSDRVEITWADGAIDNEWLQVTMKADADTGLAGTDVFYFGDLRSDENGDGTVNFTDFAKVNADFGKTGVPVTQGDDYDKNGSVDNADFALVNADFNHSLPMITAPVQARSSYDTSYCDAVDRLTDQVNVGTNGGTPYARPASVPSRSDTVLVNHTDYDNAGNVADTIDPRGIQNNFTYDLLNRTLEEVDGYSGPASSGKSQTDYTYDSNGDVISLTASFPGTSTPSQSTDYIYGTTGTIGSNLFSNDLISQVRYPDPLTGTAGGSSTDDVNYGYDLQGETTSMTDRNGSTHGYTYDVLGRLKLDAVTTLGSGVDGSIRALGFNYNALGLSYQQTSYSDASGASVVNQVQDVYNGYGQLTTQYQEPAAR